MLVQARGAVIATHIHFYVQDSQISLVSAIIWGREGSIVYSTLVRSQELRRADIWMGHHEERLCRGMQ